MEQFFPGKGYIAAGFDVNASILRTIKAGHLQFTIDQQPYTQGYLSVTVLHLYKRYGLMPAAIDTGATVINAQNADRVMELSRQHIR
jgi:simple sugar transport system substrate-binding protein